MAGLTKRAIQPGMIASRVQPFLGVDPTTQLHYLHPHRDVSGVETMTGELRPDLILMREQARAAYEEARRRLEAIEGVIAIAQEQNQPILNKRQQRGRSSEEAQAMILAILRDAPAAGLNSAQIAVELAARSNTARTATSVGMHLSKLRKQQFAEKVGRFWRAIGSSTNEEPANAEASAGPASRSAPEGAGQIEGPKDIV